METTPTLIAETIREAYEAATGEWSGCDWNTQHGSTEIDLDGEQAADLRRYADLLEAGESAELEAVWDHIPTPNPIEDWGAEDPYDDDALAEAFARRRTAWIDDLRSGADWLDEVASLAASAEQAAAEAMERLEAGDIAGAGALAKTVYTLECTYGDDPVWGEWRRLLESLAADN